MAGRAVNWALRSWGGRATCGGLIALHQFDTHYRYNRFNRCLRSVGAACLTLYGSYSGHTVLRQCVPGLSVKVNLACMHA